MLSLLPAMTTLTGCAHGSTAAAGVRTVHDYCLIAQGISYASQPAGQQEDSSNKFDTKETVTQVEAHNLAYQRTCPQPPAAAPK
jgi:hypothetical protein